MNFNQHKRINDMRFLPLLLFCVTVFFVGGCGDSPSKRGIPPLVPCSLTFLFEDDAPVDGASIRLLPDDPDSKWAMSGFTASDGTAEISTDGDFPGVPKGTYKVTCTKSEQIPTGKKSEEGEEVFDSKLLVAKEYSRPNTTPLTLTVGGAPVNEVFKIKKP